MIKPAIPILILILIFQNSYAQKIEFLESEIEEKSDINILITELESSSVKQAIIYSTISFDTIDIDSAQQNYHHKLLFPSSGSFYVIVKLLNGKYDVVFERSSQIKISKRIYLQKLDKLFGPIIGALIASLIFVLNNYINQLIYKTKLTNQFKIKLNSLLEKTITDSSSDYLDEILKLINNPNHPIMLPYSNGGILKKTNEIKSLIMRFKARSNSTNIKTLANKFKGLKL